MPSSLLLLYPSQNSSSIHSSSAVPDFNFTINQQNKQTSGREGERGRGGVVRCEVVLQGGCKE